MSNPDMVELAERLSEIAHVKCAHEIMNKLLPNHLLSFQVMKKKNTGVKEVIQGHRAKADAPPCVPSRHHRRCQNGPQPYPNRMIISACGASLVRFP